MAASRVPRSPAPRDDVAPPSAFVTSIDDAPRRRLRLDRGATAQLVDGAHGRARNLDVHVNYLEPGSGPGPRHYHEEAENVYIVLGGVIEVEIEGEVHRLQPNQVAFIPPGLIHSTSNPGAETATFIEIYAPAGSDFHIVAEDGES